MKVAEVQGLLDELANCKFFSEQKSAEELERMGAHLTQFAELGAEGDQVSVKEIYNCVACDTDEGQILLNVSRMFTAAFAFFMGFLSTFLNTLGVSLGHVYMSMGCLVGSAVG